MATTSDTDNVKLPRVAITFCTQCKWMLRAAYFGQELLSTFGTTIGEIALIPATGGLFQVNLTYQKPGTEVDGNLQPSQVLIWDRKTEGGFPETKVLKQLIRNHIDPAKNLGHSDTAGKASKDDSKPLQQEAMAQQAQASASDVPPNADKPAEECADCK